MPTHTGTQTRPQIWRAAVIVTAVTLATVLAACSPGSATDETGLRTPPQTEAAPEPSGTASGAELARRSDVTLSVADGADGGAAEGRTLTIPEGWAAEVWMDVPGARLAVWTPDARLIVSTGDRGTLTLLTPVADRAPEETVLLDGLDNPQGVAFARMQGRDVLVVGEATRIVVWDYADGAVSDRRVLVEGLPASGHGSKAVAVDGDTVYYSLGSRDNRDPADRATDPERASIWQVSLDGSGNRLVARGVRNGFGLDLAPDDTLFTAVNQADNQPYPFRDDTGAYGGTDREYVNENPIEQVSRITPGTDLGWPLCVPDTRETPDLTDIPFVNDPTFNPDGARLDCSTLPNTMLGLPAHSAPLGLTFTSDTSIASALGEGALISAHGSWNRQPPRPPSWRSVRGTPRRHVCCPRSSW